MNNCNDKDIKLNEAERTSMGSLVVRARHGDTLSMDFVKYLNSIGLLGKFDEFDWPLAQTRTDYFDKWVDEYLIQFPESKVINLGAGFCTRYQRFKNVGVEIPLWVELDLPQIIDLREKVDPQTENHVYVKQDLTECSVDFLYYLSEFDLVIADGILIYIDKDSVHDIVTHSQYIIFDGRGKGSRLGDDQNWVFDLNEWKKYNIVRYRRYSGLAFQGFRNDVIVECSPQL